jgi:hypothetical protein
VRAYVSDIRMTAIVFYYAVYNFTYEYMTDLFRYLSVNMSHIRQNKLTNDNTSQEHKWLITICEFNDCSCSCITIFLLSMLYFCYCWCSLSLWSHCTAETSRTMMSRPKSELRVFFKNTDRHQNMNPLSKSLWKTAWNDKTDLRDESCWYSRGKDSSRLDFGNENSIDVRLLDNDIPSAYKMSISEGW